MYEKFQISMKGWFDHQIMGFWVMGFFGANPFSPYPIPYQVSWRLIELIEAY